MNRNLLYNVTGEQTLYWDAPEGRPSTVTSVTVYSAGTGDDGTAEAATTGSASAEANPATTFDDAAGDGSADPTLIPLAATTGIWVGRTYLATNAIGETEAVEIHSVAVGSSVQARHPLRNSYSTGDTFESTRISISIDDTWISDETNISDDMDPNPGYRVRWVYVVDGITRVHDSYFNVVRYRSGHDVLPADIDNKRPGWLNNLPVEHIDDRGRILIDDAYTDFTFDLHQKRIPAEMLRNRSVVNQLVKLRVLMNSTHNEAVRTGDPTAYDIDREAYTGALNALIPETSIAEDSDGSGGGRVTAPVSRR